MLFIYRKLQPFFYKSVKKDASRKLLLLSGCAMFTGVNWPGSAAVRKHGGQKAGNASNVFNELEQEVKNISAPGELEMSSAGSRLGKTVVECEHLGLDYNGVTYIKDFSYILLRNDRVGIVGPNGSGKTTLMDILAGKLVPDRGSVQIGQTVRIGYFSQHSEFPDSEQRVLEYIRDVSESHRNKRWDKDYCRTDAGTVLFPSELQWVPVNKLSGGEKRRLYLLRVLMGAPNVLLLDERPTILTSRRCRCWRIIWTVLMELSSQFRMTVTF